MKILVGIFLLGVILRFLYFPDNVYFAYDQARDSFTSLEILKGDFKLVGPPSFLSDKLFPGPLIFYIYAPIYAIFDKNPEAVSAFFRLFNALGIFLTFAIGTTIFNRKVGLLAALLFAFSYEQTQYSLFISHQPLAVISVLLFYLGLSLFLFKRNINGLILITLGWGLSIQFHYGYILLFIPLFFIMLTFRKNLDKVSLKYLFLSFLTLSITLFTFIITELKYHFFSSFLFQNSTTRFAIYPQETIQIINRFLYDIFLADYRLTPYILVLGTISSLSILIFRKNLRPRLLFLSFWFLGGLAPYLMSGVPSYYYSAAASVSLLIAIAYLISYLLPKYKLLGLSLVVFILINNLNQIITINKTGVNSNMVIQPGMLVSDQKRALNYIYQQAAGQPFSINALTIPLQVNTTWSYLFEWYGKTKYAFVPTFGGDAAEGYLGNFKVMKDRSQLPQLQFLIIEPTLGIREAYMDNFFREEGYFTKVIEERHFGNITIQKRQKY